MHNPRCADGDLKRYALAVHWSSADGVWIADAPDLRYCSSHGATPDEAVRELMVAMELWIETVLEAGEALPPPRFRAPAAAAE
jgi:predicted RNase H-like HicB family nuclease